MAAEKKPLTAVEYARFLFKAHYASCFWHWKPDFVVTETTIPLIVKGLCAHGGRIGMSAAGELQTSQEK